MIDPVAEDLVSALRDLNRRGFRVGLRDGQPFWTPELPEPDAARVRVHDDALQRLLERFDRPAGGLRSGAPPAPGGVTNTEQGIFLAEQKAGGVSLYNRLFLFRLTGRLDLDALDAALFALTDRHEALRTTFHNVDGELQKIILPSPATRRILRRAPAGGDIDQIAEAAYLDSIRPLDLSEGPLFRACIHPLGEDDHLLTVVVHHLVFDYLSYNVMLDEIGQGYAAALQNTRAAPHHDVQAPGKPPDAWGEAGLHAGACLRIPGPEGLLASLRSVAAGLGVSPQSILFATFALLISRVTDRDEGFIGATVSLRRSTDQMKRIGLHIASLPVPFELSPGAPAGDFVRQSHRDLMEQFEIASSTQDRLVTEAPALVTEDQHRYGFEFYEGVVHTLELPGLVATSISPPVRLAKGDLSLLLRPTARGSVTLTLEYATHVYDAATVAQLGRIYLTLLESLLEAPQTPVLRLRAVGAAGEQEWFRRSAGPAGSISTERFHETFDRVAARGPESPACVAPGRSLTYGELQRQSLALARRLADAGVGPDARVALLLDRDADLIVSILAVSRIGSAHVLIDPGVPVERRGDILRDAEPDALILGHGIDPPSRFSGVTIGVSSGGGQGERDQVQSGSASSHDDLAYVVYTSDPTGRPKGVGITWAGLMTYLQWAHQEYAGLEPMDSIVPNSLDAEQVMTSLYLPLLSGGRIEFVPDDDIELEEVRRAIARRRRRCLLRLPLGDLETLSERAVPGDSDQGMVFVVEGGPLPMADVELCARRFPGALIYSEHGPGETAAACTARRLAPAGPPDRPEALAGQPIAGVRAYVLDRYLRACPPGLVGQLYIGGRGIARGYMGQPELTAERFVADPFGEPGARMYASGDLARWSQFGLEYVGRLDDQVQIHGHRVEPGEISAALKRLGIAEECAVVLEADAADPHLVAYVRSRIRPSDEQILERLRPELPRHMHPSRFVWLDELPMSSSGTLDKARLAILAAGRATSSTRTEQKVQNIWREVFGRDLSVTDDFFDLGGHSLVGIKLVSRLRAEFPAPINLSWIFEAPTVRELAAKLDRAAAVTPPA